MILITKMPWMDRTSILFSLCALTLLGGVWATSQESVCSYHGVLSHLDLEQRSAVLAELRPVKNFTQPTHVSVDMLLNGILDVNERTQTFSCFVTVAITWFNDFLQWDPDDFCGIGHIHVQREKLWIPDIFIVENIADIDRSRYNRYTLLVRTGLTQVVDRFPLIARCKLELYRFPFDTQTCSITFQSILNRDLEVTLGTALDQDTLKKNTEDILTSLEEWEMVDINMTVGKYNIGSLVWDQLKYTITLKRRPLLYIINLVMPVSFLLFLDLASFFIDEARGEKLGFKVTILLSISVFLLILKDLLPSTANHLPVIALHCIVVFILTGVSLLETILVGFLVHMDRQDDEDVHLCTKTTCQERQDDAKMKEPGRDAECTLEELECQPNDREQHCVLWLMVLKKWCYTHLKPSKKKAGFYGIVAQKVDWSYFCFYFTAVIAFMVYIFKEWFP